MELNYIIPKFYRKKRPLRNGGFDDMKEPNRIIVDGKVKKCPVYERWHHMLRRSTPDHWLKHPEYEGVTVCEEWKLRSNFHNWMISQYRWWDFHLDKDLLDPSNKQYAPDKCVFVPQYINSLLTDRINYRGDLPLGVTYEKDRQKYMAQCNVNGVKSKRLGNFKTPEEAHAAYQIAKASEVFRVAELALSSGDIDHRVYESLIMRAEKLLDDHKNGVITLSIHHY